MLRMALPVSVCAALLWWAMSMPVRELQVHGELRHGDRAAIAAELRALALGRPLARLDLQRLAAAAGRSDWVREVRVVRRWPRTLEVHLREHRPIARWQRRGESGYINRRGEYFGAAPLPSLGQLPLLSSPGAEVGAHWLYLSAVLGRHGLRITELRQGADGGWRVLLDNGTGLQLGGDSLRREMRRFERLWSHLGARRSQVAHIDLRYEAAAAVRWRRQPGGRRDVGGG